MTPPHDTPQTSPYALQVRGLTRHFGDVTALDGVDLDLGRGTVTSILGPSGCGKTTLLRLVAGFLAPDAGTVELEGRPVSGPDAWVPPQARHVGYLPQEGALFPHLDVAGNIGFGLARAQRTPARIREMLDLVELPASFTTRAPHELSGGQQQRVALARALAPRPALVLLDEPFSALDATLRQSTGRSVVRALRAAGATGLLVTHDQAEALSLADQVVTLRSGRLVQAADPVTSYLQPVDVEQAQFVGGAGTLPARWDGSVATSALGMSVVSNTDPTWMPDTPLTLVVRPEQVLLGPGAAQGSATVGPEAAVGPEAVVSEVNFYGHDAEVSLTLCSANPTSQTLVARVTGAVPPVVGDRVSVAVEGAVRAFAR